MSVWLCHTLTTHWFVCRCLILGDLLFMRNNIFSPCLFLTIWISPTRLPLHVVHVIVHSTYNFTTCIHVYSTSFPCIEHAVWVTVTALWPPVAHRYGIYTTRTFTHIRDMYVHVSFTPDISMLTCIHSRSHTYKLHSYTHHVFHSQSFVYHVFVHVTCIRSYT